MTARLLMALALAGAGFALVAAGCGGDGSSAPSTETDHTNHTTTTATPSATAVPGTQTIAIVVKQARPQGGIKTYTVKQGRRVAIVVTSDTGDSVHLHGYWIEKPVVAGTPTRIMLTADTPGRFEIELHEPDAVLGNLQIEP